MVSVLIIDDHKLVASGTKQLLKRAGFEAESLFSVDQLQEAMRKTPYDVFLVDWNLPGTNGLQVAEKIIKEASKAKIIIYTGFDQEIPPVFDELIDEGISGVISKSSSIETLTTSIRAVICGQAVFPLGLVKEMRKRNRLLKEVENHFDQQEIEIMKELTEGKTNQLIAAQLHISQRTMEYQLKKIYGKLDVHSREEACKMIQELNLFV